MVQIRHLSKTTQIVLSPNRSLNWKEAKWVMLIMVCVVMIIAIAWSFVGAWLVLPFAGIEVGLFVFLLYRVTKWTYTKQVITFYESHIDIETGINRRNSLETIDIEGLEIHLYETDLNWKAPSLSFFNKGLTIHIGEFLNSDDVYETKDAFERLGFSICTNMWWKHQ